MRDTRRTAFVIAQRLSTVRDADLMLEVLDRRGGALQQLVDLIPVVSAKRFTDIDVT